MAAISKDIIVVRKGNVTKKVPLNMEESYLNAGWEKLATDSKGQPKYKEVTIKDAEGKPKKSKELLFEGKAEAMVTKTEHQKALDRIAELEAEVAGLKAGAAQ